MNTLRFLLLAALCAFSPLSRADVQSTTATDAPAQVVASPVSTKPVPPVWTETRDAFLSFALDKAKTYSGKAEEIAAKAVDSAVKEGPATAAEFLKWRAWFHGLHVLFPVVLWVVLGGGFIYGIRKALKTGGYDHGWAIPYTLFGGAGMIMLTFWLFDSLNDHLYPFVQILIAPRIYMIEQVLHLFGK